LTGLDYTSWNALTDADKLLVCAAVSGGSFTNFADFANAVNVAITNPAQIPTTNNNGNRNPGGGRGDGTVAIPSTVLEEDRNNIVQGAPFTDLASVSWAQEAITELYKKGIVSGRSAHSFDPNAPVTRAELIKMLVSALDISVSSVSTSFKDVEPSSWYAGYVSAAEANGLTNGDENGNFNPEKPISRQDAVTILYRSYNNKNAVKKASFADSDAISDYAKEAVDYMVSLGIINGMGNGEFAPLDNLSRAQLSKMIYMMIK
ncbi:MAG: S-layer homology domain-containing protein, partial [Oscillospiraceae bacterium]|nr:S-layer homology domain-containing protein [Oscillospiraceae bacterium]